MNKKLTLTILFVIMLIALITTTVQANYQSIPTGTIISAYANDWITGIRQMESEGQGMGLTETIDTTTALSTSGSNNIDVHLAKNTEYGTALLLGASDYGKQGNSIEDRRMDKGAKTGTAVQASTTGNKYGIYEMGYYNMYASRNDIYEWTAGGGRSVLYNIAPRYMNRYAYIPVEKVGDATLSTQYWHSSGSASLYFANEDHGILRGAYGAFSYIGHSVNDRNLARAGVVCGTGF